MCTQTSVDVHDRKQKPQLISFNTEFELIVVKKKKKKLTVQRAATLWVGCWRFAATAEETEEGLGKIHHHITGNGCFEDCFSAGNDHKSCYLCFDSIGCRCSNGCMDTLK